MKFKKCILHIGSEKTGTTSLQEFLKLNRDKLHEQGYYIPKTMGPSEHIDFVCLFADSKKKFSRRRRLGLQTPQQTDEHKKELALRISAEMSEAADSEKTLIISTERLFTMISNESEILQLKNFLLKFSEQVEVVAYIRAQHEFALSIYSTALKRGRYQPTCLPKIVEGTISERSYNYFKVLSFWKKHFSEAKLTVKKHQKQSLVDGDTISDFSELVGIDHKPLIIPNNHNVSLSATAQSFLRHFNKYIPTVDSKNSAKHRSNVNKILTDHCQGPSLLPSKNEAIKFYKKFEESNEKLRTEWFPDDENLFDVSFDKYSDQADEVELSLDQCFEIFSKIYIVNTDAMDYLYDELKK